MTVIDIERKTKDIKTHVMTSRPIVNGRDANAIAFVRLTRAIDRSSSVVVVESVRRTLSRAMSPSSSASRASSASSRRWSWTRASARDASDASDASDERTNERTTTAETPETPRTPTVTTNSNANANAPSTMTKTKASSMVTTNDADASDGEALARRANAASDDESDVARKDVLVVRAEAKQSQSRARVRPRAAKAWALARFRARAPKRARARALHAMKATSSEGKAIAFKALSVAAGVIGNVAKNWFERDFRGKARAIANVVTSAGEAIAFAFAGACAKCWAPKAHGLVTAFVVAMASRNAKSTAVFEGFVQRKFGDVAGEIARTIGVTAPRLARACVATWARWQAMRLAARAIAPRQARKVEYSLRVAPVLASYMVAKRRIARIEDGEKRDQAWERQHQWGAARMRDVIEDFGGFYRKVGQIAGTAKQMMPAAYIDCFSKTMDNNPPVSFRKVRKTLEDSLGGPLGLHFAELSRKPVATASIAQVHFGRLLDGREVAVKVQATDSSMMIGDIYNMLSTTKAMRLLGLNEGLDFPTIFRAYLDVIDEEFDFTIEARKTEEFAKLLDDAGLSDRIVVPTVITATRRVLIMRRVRGMKLLTLFNRARSNNKIPRCPSPVAKCHAVGGRGWRGVFYTMFEAWGVMMLQHGHFHSDPHPGNFMVGNDGRLVLLDWGQTKRVSDLERMHMCRLSLYMANEDHYSIAYEIREHGSVRLEKPTTEALSALAFAYFDTRPSALAEMNVMDFKNSPFVHNKIVQNTQEGFFAIRSVFLLRGMLSTCGLEMSMVEAWESIARRALIEHGHAPPSRLRLKARKMVNRSIVGLQRRFNVGSGAKLNTLDAYMATREPTSDAPGRWLSTSSFW